MSRINCYFLLVALSATVGATTPGFAQPVEYVKVCTLYGARYYYSPGTDTCINADTGVTLKQTADGVVPSKTALAQSVEDIDNRVARAFENSSIAAALTSPDLVAGEHFGVRINWGNAGMSNAMGLTGAAVLGEGLFAGGSGRLTGTAGVAFAGRSVGGNAGLQLTW
ncbi:porin [Mesorhizobium sp. B283B1A]|uniref:porin n=1 Tax=Mesorhizobium TaxID=68287 RepID=UPI001CD0F198|nr:MULTISPECIES: porin [Mesorhizobium]MCA0045783.1 porin [Mesorhizobium sp. B283B1A]UQS67699.1 porin [Mesorhizobium opportunistum]